MKISIYGIIRDMYEFFIKKQCISSIKGALPKQSNDQHKL